jgi:non-specific protein-tyrosine kinase
MELKPYLTILWRKRGLILIVIFITMGIVSIGSLITPPVYAATTILRVAASSGGSLSYTDFIYNDRLLNTYTMLAVSRPVLDEVSQKLGLAVQPEVQVEIIVNTELIRVTAEDADPVVAQNIANTLAEVLIIQSKELYTGGGKSTKEILAEQVAQLGSELEQARSEYEQLVAQSPHETERIAAASQVVELKNETYAALLKQYEEARLQEQIRANTITIIEPAKRPDDPVRPNLLLNFGLGFGLSLVAGIGLAFLFNYFDTTIYTAAEAEKWSKLPTLGEIPNEKSDQLLISANNDPMFREAFRRLRMNLFSTGSADELHTILVTGTGDKVGTSTVAADLALAIAHAGKKVVVLDCNLNSPHIHKLFGLTNETGLVDVLKEQTSFSKAVQEVEKPAVKVLTGGASEAGQDFWELAPDIRTLLNYLPTNFDVILIDSAPISTSAETAMLAEMVDGILLVARAGKTSGEALNEALKQTSNLPARTLGTVLNRTA